MLNGSLDFIALLQTINWSLQLTLLLLQVSLQLLKSENRAQIKMRKILQVLVKQILSPVYTTKNTIRRHLKVIHGLNADV